jgi:hypothetical protein
MAPTAVAACTAAVAACTAAKATFTIVIAIFTAVYASISEGSVYASDRISRVFLRTRVPPFISEKLDLNGGRAGGVGDGTAVNSLMWKGAIGRIERAEQGERRT